MNRSFTLLSLCLLCSVFTADASDCETLSPGNTTYYINPAYGNDADSGLSEDEAWKSFKRVNRMLLSTGDRIEIISPGAFHRTLKVSGSGTRQSPIEVHFAAGRYDFYPKHLLHKQFNISNTNDEPDDEKAIALFIDDAKHVKVSSDGARIVCRGKMIELCIDNSEDVTISNLQFDYKRPTVSEFKIHRTGKDYADLKIHPDSHYRVTEGQIQWIGEGWEHGLAPLMQILDPETDAIRRSRNLLKGLKFEEIGPHLVRAHGAHTLKQGWIYQVRETGRDYAGVFVRRSKNIGWKDVHFQFLHGMGMVHQFSENLTFDSVKIAPNADNGRTAAGWADGIHLSGCRGQIIVRNCVFSGLQDDAINVHGTHLRIVETLPDQQIKVRFMHKQTYGFMAFNPGDKVMFTRWDSLENYAENTVTAAELLEPRVLLLTMKDPLPEDIHKNDVLENVTWTPEVEITDCKVMRVPTRGFLITTRRKVVVEDSSFYRTRMSGILIENDAKGWFESGPVRDMTIRNNRFFYCREPVIHLNPQNSRQNPAVHQNIRIYDNEFTLNNQVAIKASSTTGLSIKGNKIYADEILENSKAIVTEDCAGVNIGKNLYFTLE